ncbi:MAG: type II secretion system protein N, partial [Kiritimatiellia bacterium]
LSMQNVKIVSIDPNGKKDASTVIEADSVAVRVGLFSLLEDAVDFDGFIDLGDSGIAFEGRFNRAKAQLTNLRATAPTLQVQDLLALAAPYTGGGIKGDGQVDLDLKIKLGDDVKDYKGKLSLKGKGIQTDLSIPDPINPETKFELGKGKISTLDFVVDLDDGVAKISRGTLRSTYLNLTLTGDINLNQRMMRSRLRMTAVIGNLHENFKVFESFMSGAKWDDDQYHYRVACTFQRFGAGCFRPDRQRAGRSSRSLLEDRGSAGDSAGSGDPDDAAAQAEERREQRRQARERRLEERRNRIKESSATRPNDRDDDMEDEMDDEDMEDRDNLELEVHDPNLIDPRHMVAPLDLPMNLPSGGVGVPGGPDGPGMMPDHPNSTSGGFE